MENINYNLFVFFNMFKIFFKKVVSAFKFVKSENFV